MECSLDADITLLLCVEEEEQYLARSLKAATNASPDLLPCQKADCDGVAVAGGGAQLPSLTIRQSFNTPAGTVVCT